MNKTALWTPTDVFGLWDPFFRSYENSTKSYPPYNVISISDEKFIIEFALAGYTKDDIEVLVTDDKLTINGQKVDDTERNYLYKGISSKKFSKSFTLNNCDVCGVYLENGILKIELYKVIPENKRPKKLEIKQ